MIVYWGCVRQAVPALPYYRVRFLWPVATMFFPGFQAACEMCRLMQRSFKF
jgi:hypothetical protein